MKLWEFTIVINSHNFMCTRWFYSHSEASVHGHEVFAIREDILPPGITYFCSTFYCESLCKPQMNSGYNVGY